MLCFVDSRCACKAAAVAQPWAVDSFVWRIEGKHQRDRKRVFKRVFGLPGAWPVAVLENIMTTPVA
jgi:hypothetical protein